MNNHDLELVEKEIRESKIIIDSAKDNVINEIKSKLNNVTRKTWFDVKMILFRNRYDNIDKDKFFNWIFATHLRELLN